MIIKVGRCNSVRIVATNPPTLILRENDTSIEIALPDSLRKELILALMEVKSNERDTVEGCMCADAET